MVKKKIKCIIFVLIIIGKDLPCHCFYDPGPNGTIAKDTGNESLKLPALSYQQRLDEGSVLETTTKEPPLRIVSKMVTRPRPYPSVSFPPFHSKTSISQYDVRVNVKDSSLLECAGTHRYCVNKGLNQSTVKSMIFCSCETNCYMYGDCCWDAPKPETFKNDFLVSDWKRNCVEVTTGAFSRESFTMTAGCPDDYLNNEYKKYCQDGYPEKNHDLTNHELIVWISRRLPVTSLSSNVTFANIFCAICNNAKKVTPWELLPVNCVYPNETLYLNDSWSEFLQTSRHPSLMSLLRYCSIVYRKPDLGSQTNKIIRACDNEVVKKCLNHGTSERLQHMEKQCKYYYAPVEARSKSVKTKFKNKFCAFCAGLSERELNCIAGGHSRKPIEHAPVINDLPPLALFFDFSLSYNDDDHELGSGISCLKKEKTDNVPELSVLLGKHKMTTNWRNRCLLGSSMYEKDCYLGTIEPTPPMSRDSCLRFDRILTVVCLGASLVALLAKFICHLAVKRSVSLASRCVLLLAMSVFSYQLLLLIGSTSADIPGACKAVGVSIHYFFLASFFWMNVLAFDVHRTFSSPYEIPKPNAKRRLIGYNAYAWLTPAVIVLLAVGTDFTTDWKWLKPNYGQGSYGVCWISNNRALIVFFALPLTLLLLVNWTFFILASFKIASTAKSTSKARENNKGKRKDRLRLILFIKLALLMGLTWILGIISSYGNSDSLRYLYITVNGLQGVFIFLAFARVPWKTGFDRIHQFVGSINLERSSFSRGNRSSDDSRTTFTHSARV